MNIIKNKIQNNFNNRSVTQILLAKQSMAHFGSCVNFKPTKQMCGLINKDMYDHIAFNSNDSQDNIIIVIN